jgi:hypothetical protein
MVTAPRTRTPPFFHAGTVVAVDRTVSDTPVPCKLLLRALPRRFRLQYQLVPESSIKENAESGVHPLCTTILLPESASGLGGK